MDTERSSALDLTDKAPTPEQALAENELRADVIHAISLLGENLRIVVSSSANCKGLRALKLRDAFLTVSAVKHVHSVRDGICEVSGTQYGAPVAAFRQNAEYECRS